MAKFKLFNRFSKWKGKYSLLGNSSYKQRIDNFEDELANATNEDDDADDDNSLKHHLLKNNNKLSYEDYICTCCFEILYSPVSLVCGHNICQLCLANWFLISSKRICPTCRQQWTGVPKSNLILK